MMRTPAAAAARPAVPVSRRLTALVGTVASLGAAAAIAAGPATPAAAASLTTSNSVPIPIGSQEGHASGPGFTVSDAMIFPGVANPYPSAAAVDGLTGTVTDVNLTIEGLSHARPNDLDIMLVAPTGERVVVMSDVGGTQPVLTGVFIDDEAIRGMVPTEPLTGGSYRPTNAVADDLFLPPAPSSAGAPSALSTFDGLDGNGTWELFAVDDQQGSVGSVLSWNLLITTSSPSGNPSVITVAGATGVVTDVDVSLVGLSHDRPHDVDLLLVGPQGQQATVLSDAGEYVPVPPPGVDLVLDDEAATQVMGALAPGRYRPTNIMAGGPSDDIYPSGAPTPTGSASLAAFDGTDLNGQWRLYLADDLPGAGGRLAGWSLTITTTDPSQGGTPTPGSTPSPTPTPTTEDTTAPRVAASRPAARTTGVRRAADVVATLSEAVRPGSVTRRTAYLVAKGSSRPVRATVTWERATRRILIDPRRPLRVATTYQAVVTTAVTDLAGNPLDQKPSTTGLQQQRWRFTTR